MKKEYKKPLAEMVKFLPEDDIMDDASEGGDMGNTPGMGGETGGGSRNDDEFDW